MESWRWRVEVELDVCVKSLQERADFVSLILTPTSDPLKFTVEHFDVTHQDIFQLISISSFDVTCTCTQIHELEYVKSRSSSRWLLRNFEYVVLAFCNLEFRHIFNK